MGWEMVALKHPGAAALKHPGAAATFHAACLAAARPFVVEGAPIRGELALWGIVGTAPTG